MLPISSVRFKIFYSLIVFFVLSNYESMVCASDYQFLSKFRIEKNSQAVHLSPETSFNQDGYNFFILSFVKTINDMQILSSQELNWDRLISEVFKKISPLYSKDDFMFAADSKSLFVTFKNSKGDDGAVVYQLSSNKNNQIPGKTLLFEQDLGLINVKVYRSDDDLEKFIGNLGNDLSEVNFKEMFDEHKICEQIINTDDLAYAEFLLYLIKLKIDSYKSSNNDLISLYISLEQLLINNKINPEIKLSIETKLVDILTNYFKFNLQSLNSKIARSLQTIALDETKSYSLRGKVFEIIFDLLKDNYQKLTSDKKIFTKSGQLMTEIVLNRSFPALLRTKAAEIIYQDVIDYYLRTKPESKNNRYLSALLFTITIDPIFNGQIRKYVFDNVKGFNLKLFQNPGFLENNASLLILQASITKGGLASLKADNDALDTDKIEIQYLNDILNRAVYNLRCMSDLNNYTINIKFIKNHSEMFSFQNQGNELDVIFDYSVLEFPQISEKIAIFTYFAKQMFEHGYNMRSRGFLSFVFMLEKMLMMPNFKEFDLHQQDIFSIYLKNINSYMDVTDQKADEKLKQHMSGFLFSTQRYNDLVIIQNIATQLDIIEGNLRNGEFVMADELLNDFLTGDPLAKIDSFLSEANDQIVKEEIVRIKSYMLTLKDLTHAYTQMLESYDNAISNVPPVLRIELFEKFVKMLPQFEYVYYHLATAYLDQALILQKDGRPEEEYLTLRNGAEKISKAYKAKHPLAFLPHLVMGRINEASFMESAGKEDVFKGADLQYKNGSVNLPKVYTTDQMADYFYALELAIKRANPKEVNICIIAIQQVISNMSSQGGFSGGTHNLAIKKLIEYTVKFEGFNHINGWFLRIFRYLIDQRDFDEALKLKDTFLVWVKKYYNSAELYDYLNEVTIARELEARLKFDTRLVNDQVAYKRQEKQYLTHYQNALNILKPNLDYYEAQQKLASMIQNKSVSASQIEKAALAMGEEKKFAHEFATLNFIEYFISDLKTIHAFHSLLLGSQNKYESYFVPFAIEHIHKGSFAVDSEMSKAHTKLIEARFILYSYLAKQPKNKALLTLTKYEMESVLKTVKQFLDESVKSSRVDMLDSLKSTLNDSEKSKGKILIKKNVVKGLRSLTDDENLSEIFDLYLFSFDSSIFQYAINKNDPYVYSYLTEYLRQKKKQGDNVFIYKDKSSKELSVFLKRISLSIEKNRELLFQYQSNEIMKNVIQTTIGDLLDLENYFKDEILKLKEIENLKKKEKLLAGILGADEIPVQKQENIKKILATINTKTFNNSSSKVRKALAELREYQHIEIKSQSQNLIQNGLEQIISKLHDLILEKNVIDDSVSFQIYKAFCDLHKFDSANFIEVMSDLSKEKKDVISCVLRGLKVDVGMLASSVTANKKGKKQKKQVLPIVKNINRLDVLIPFFHELAVGNNKNEIITVFKFISEQNWLPASSKADLGGIISNLEKDIFNEVVEKTYFSGDRVVFLNREQVKNILQESTVTDAQDVIQLMEDKETELFLKFYNTHNQEDKGASFSVPEARVALIVAQSRKILADGDKKLTGEFNKDVAVKKVVNYLNNADRLHREINKQRNQGFHAFMPWENLLDYIYFQKNSDKKLDLNIFEGSWKAKGNLSKWDIAREKIIAAETKHFSDNPDYGDLFDEAEWQKIIKDAKAQNLNWKDFVIQKVYQHIYLQDKFSILKGFDLDEAILLASKDAKRLNFDENLSLTDFMSILQEAEIDRLVAMFETEDVSSKERLYYRIKQSIPFLKDAFTDNNTEKNYSLYLARSIFLQESDNQILVDDSDSSFYLPYILNQLTSFDSFKKDNLTELILNYEIDFLQKSYPNITKDKIKNQIFRLKKGEVKLEEIQKQLLEESLFSVFNIARQEVGSENRLIEEVISLDPNLVEVIDYEFEDYLESAMEVEVLPSKDNMKEILLSWYVQQIAKWFYFEKKIDLPVSLIEAELVRNSALSSNVESFVSVLSEYILVVKGTLKIEINRKSMDHSMEFSIEEQADLEKLKEAMNDTDTLSKLKTILKYADKEKMLSFDKFPVISIPFINEEKEGLLTMIQAFNDSYENMFHLEYDKIERTVTLRIDKDSEEKDVALFFQNNGFRLGLLDNVIGQSKDLKIKKFRFNKNHLSDDVAKKLKRSLNQAISDVNFFNDVKKQMDDDISSKKKQIGDCFDFFQNAIINIAKSEFKEIDFGHSAQLSVIEINEDDIKIIDVFSKYLKEDYKTSLDNINSFMFDYLVDAALQKNQISETKTQLDILNQLSTYLKDGMIFPFIEEISFELKKSVVNRGRSDSVENSANFMIYHFLASILEYLQTNFQMEEGIDSKKSDSLEEISA